MIDEICAEIRNYFSPPDDRYIGNFSVVNGVIFPSLSFPTDYIRIVGSRKNDGVHKVSENDLIDEGEFHGAVWVMTPPQAFLKLVAEITAWQDKYGGVDSVAMSPYNSESFGGYSYSKSGSGYGSGSSAVVDWRSAFAGRLNLYRRMLTV